MKGFPDAAFKRLVRAFEHGSFYPNCACCGKNVFGMATHIDWRGKRFLHDAKRCRTGVVIAVPAPRSVELVAA
ncbi:MAG: hypothetical protein Q7R63_02110 [bacterium]|nr:hypothetical protein [bacterium]